MGTTDMKTKERLADAMREAGLPAEFVARAQAGEFDDFESTQPLPFIHLVQVLGVLGTPAALAVIERARNGEFDATDEEAAEWAASAEGQYAYKSVLRTRADK